MENQDILNDLVSALKKRPLKASSKIATVSKIIKEAILEKNDSFVKEKEELHRERKLKQTRT